MAKFLILIAGLGLSWLLYSLFKRLYMGLYHLSNIPGPTLAAFSRAWLLSVYVSSDPPGKLLQVQEKYGSIVRIGPNNVMIDDPEAMIKILSPQSGFLRGAWFEGLRLEPQATTMVNARDPAKHKIIRQRLFASYTDRKRIDETQLNKRLNSWKESLKQDIAKASTGEIEIEIARNIRSLLLELMAQLFFSKGLGINDTQKDQDVFWDLIEKTGPIGQFFCTLPELSKFSSAISSIKFVQDYFAKLKTKDPGYGKLFSAVKILTHERYADSANEDAKTSLPPDVLRSWKRIGLSRQDAEAEVQIGLIAGAFPIAAATIVILLHILSSPRIFQHLDHEIRRALAAESNSKPVISYIESLQLPYLQACIKEGLRRYAPITQLFERVVPVKGATICNRFVPGGTNVGFNMRGIQLNSCFGDDPGVFRPERWLPSEVDPTDTQSVTSKLAEMHTVQRLVFGYGATQCVGMTQVSMIISKIIFEVLRTFDITIVDPMRPITDRNSGASFYSDFKVRMRPRNQSIHE